MVNKTETKKEKVHETTSEAPKAKVYTPKKDNASKNHNIDVKSAQLKEGKSRDIGVPVSNPPKLACSDLNCPYHGHLSIRGRIFEGAVISDKMDKGVIVEWNYLMALPKYKRFMRKKSRVPAHNPLCINAHVGNVVRIAECRPISKTKSFVVIEILKG